MVGVRSREKAVDKTAGEALRVAREKKKLTIDDVSCDLRIPPVHLSALERGDLTIFTAEVYAKGAYVKYAKFLGIEGNEAYRSFLRSMSKAREMVPLKLPQTLPFLARLVTPMNIIVMFVGLAMFGVATYLGLQVQSFIHVPSLELIEPNNLVLEEDKVLVKGLAEAGSDIEVNGETVLADEFGNFETTLNLRSGINILQVSAVGVSGRENVIKRDLLVTRS